jgi:membrane protein involved in colicin uptake
VRFKTLSSMLLPTLVCALLIGLPVDGWADSGLPTGGAGSSVAQGGVPGQERPPRDGESAQEDEQRQRMEKDMAKKANQDRQAQLRRDTEKLLQLATDLKEEVDKSNENVLALEVIKKADEIEKLAHSVREKMKGSN